jgi:hypothetical protein
VEDASGSTVFGYAVCDMRGISGLTNCGWEKDDKTIAGYRRTWSARLNQHHLFDSVTDADELKAFSDSRVPENRPFFVFGIWSIE